MLTLLNFFKNFINFFSFNLTGRPERGSSFTSKLSERKRANHFLAADFDKAPSGILQEAAFIPHNYIQNAILSFYHRITC